MRKKVLIIFLAILCTACVFTACGDDSKTQENDKIEQTSQTEKEELLDEENEASEVEEFENYYEDYEINLASKDELIGTWIHYQEEMSYTFYQDNTFEFDDPESTFYGEYTYEDGVLTVDSKHGTINEGYLDKAGEGSTTLLIIDEYEYYFLKLYEDDYDEEEDYQFDEDYYEEDYQIKYNYSSLEEFGVDVDEDFDGMLYTLDRGTAVFDYNDPSNTYYPAPADYTLEIVGETVYENYKEIAFQLSIYYPDYIKPNSDDYILSSSFLFYDYLTSYAIPVNNYSLISDYGGANSYAAVIPYPENDIEIFITYSWDSEYDVGDYFLVDYYYFVASVPVEYENLVLSIVPAAEKYEDFASDINMISNFEGVSYFDLSFGYETIFFRIR